MQVALPVHTGHPEPLLNGCEDLTVHLYHFCCALRSEGLSQLLVVSAAATHRLGIIANGDSLALRTCPRPCPNGFDFNVLDRRCRTESEALCQRLYVKTACFHGAQLYTTCWPGPLRYCSSNWIQF
jgi:hypothetical protein